MEKAESLPFGVAILDVNLNGTQSFPIAETLERRQRPFLFATGYSMNSVPQSLRGAPILRKPFAQADVARGLQTALAGARSRLFSPTLGSASMRRLS